MNAIPACALLLAVLLSPLARAGDAKENGAQAPKEKAAAQAKPIPRPGPQADFKTNLAWQIALDGAHFSPGILDGTWGRKGEMAAKECAASMGLDWGKNKDGADFGNGHVKVDIDHATTPYTVGAADLAEVGPLPEDWNERAKLDRLRYPTLHECLAEKFHCTQALLARLNPGVNINGLKAGDSLTAPNLRPFPKPGSLPIGGKALLMRPSEPAIISINVVEKTIRVFSNPSCGAQLALFHCSVAKDKQKLPGRDAVIKTMASPPNYTFDPKGWPDVTNVDHKLTIAPGPRNPVGLAWIGLDLPGYGIHGNPKPELIGKTGSHGCFRLTNWDALALFSMAKTGMTVEITGAGSKEAAPNKAPAAPASTPKEPAK